MSETIFFLAALICFQQVYYLRQIQKLIDKLMSRDFHEYKVAETVKPRDTVKKGAPESDFDQDTSATLQAMF